MYATSLEKKRASEYSMTPCHEATGKKIVRNVYINVYMYNKYMFVCESGVCMLKHTYVRVCTLCTYIHRQEITGDTVRAADRTEVFMHMHKVLSLTGIRRALKKPMACSLSSTMVCPR